MKSTPQAVLHISDARSDLAEQVREAHTNTAIAVGNAIISTFAFHPPKIDPAFLFLYKRCKFIGCQRFAGKTGFCSMAHQFQRRRIRR